MMRDTLFLFFFVCKYVIITCYSCFMVQNKLCPFDTPSRVYCCPWLLPDRAGGGGIFTDNHEARWRSFNLQNCKQEKIYFPFSPQVNPLLAFQVT